MRDQPHSMYSRSIPLDAIYPLCYYLLPLGLLTGHELVKDGEVLLQTRQPLGELLLNLCLVITKLGVEVLPVGGSAHGGAEDGLDEEGVVWLKRVAVGCAEGDAKFLARGAEVLAEGLSSEVKSAEYGVSILSRAMVICK